MVLRSVGVLSVGKVMGTLYALVGLIMGAILALMAMAGGAIQAENGAEAMVPGATLGIAAIIVMPILYGIGGFIGGIVTGALYNLVAGLVGGVEMNFDAPGQQVQHT